MSEDWDNGGWDDTACKDGWNDIAWPSSECQFVPELWLDDNLVCRFMHIPKDSIGKSRLNFVSGFFTIDDDHSINTALSLTKCCCDQVLLDIQQYNPNEFIYRLVLQNSATYIADRCNSRTIYDVTCTIGNVTSNTTILNGTTKVLTFNIDKLKKSTTNNCIRIKVSKSKRCDKCKCEQKKFCGKYQICIAVAPPEQT